MARHSLTFHGRQYQVTPGALRALAQASDPPDEVFLYHLLRLEGYSEAELDRVAQTELWPPAGEQLALFAADTPGHPWRRRD